MELSAKTREIKGKKVKSLRDKGFIPAVVYSKKSSQGKADVLNLTLNKVEFQKVYEEAGETNLIKITIDEKNEVEVLVTEVQVDPLKLEVIHVSFYEVDMTVMIDTEIPVNVINEEECLPVAAGEGIIITILSEISVRSLPRDIPNEFEVDATLLTEVGAVLAVKDAIKVDSEKVEILTDPEEVVIKIDYAEQLEVEEEEISVEDIEVTSEKPLEEGEESAEDGKEKSKPEDDSKEEG